MTHPTDAPHARLMDATYRWQRHIYDVTRKYFLFGRDHLIRDLAASPGDRILEVACGTGRNLAVIGRRYPGVSLFGFDISSEMLTSAEAKLGQAARLKTGDACDFKAEILFGEEGFDRIVLSYGLSMIPDWEAAIHAAARNLAPGGAFHIVDFGDLGAYPGFARRAMQAWLAGFHVTPRERLESAVNEVAKEYGLEPEFTHLYGRYAQYAVLRRH